MVARDHDHGDVAAAEHANEGCKFALMRGRGVASAIGVTGEDDEIDFLFDRFFKRETQAFDKILQARVETGARIEPAVIFNADMRVGNVQKFDGHSREITKWESADDGRGEI